MTSPGGRLVGTVVAFDEHAGLGEVDGDGARFGFHCTQVADGSRSVPVGATVSFELRAGRGGRWEAADIRPAGPPGAIV